MHATDKRNIKVVVFTGAAHVLVVVAYAVIWLQLHRADELTAVWPWPSFAHVVAQLLCIVVGMWFLHRFFRERRRRREGGKGALVLAVLPLVLIVPALVLAFFNVYPHVRVMQDRAEAEAVCSLAVVGEPLDRLEQFMQDEDLGGYGRISKEGHMEYLSVSNSGWPPRWHCSVELDEAGNVVSSDVVAPWPTW